MHIATDLYSHYMVGIRRSPEFFYPKKFVTIKSTTAPLGISTVSRIYHGTHLDEVEEICVAPSTATFIGREKKWRPGIMYNAYEQTYSLEFCTYLIEDVDKDPKPMTKDEQWQPFGPFLWFGTSNEEADDYGPYCFEFNFKSVLKRYQKCRGSEKALCYRVGGTLVYQQEVSHVAIICCEDDKEYQSYPLIEPTSTKYFKPPTPIKFVDSKKENTEPPVHKRRKTEQCSDTQNLSTESYHDLPKEELTILKSTGSVLGVRHEHVALAFYLPDGIALELTNQDGKLCQACHDNRCLKSKGKRQCHFPQFDGQYIHSFNN